MVKLLSKIGAFFRNVVVLKWAVQFIFLGGLIAIIFNYLNIAVGNLANTNIAFSWGFLGETPGVSIAEGLYTLPKSGLQMLQTGMLNMLRITVTGIVAATFFGTILGIARLSNNYIVEKTATSLLEVVRNVPLLVQILFFQALILSLPRLEVYDVGSVLFHASSKGVALSWPNRQDGAWMFMLYFLITLYISNRVYKQRVKLLEEQGYDTHMVFVNTSLEVAQQRNKERDRVLPEKILKKSWTDTRKNLGGYKALFGSNFVLVDNSKFYKQDGSFIICPLNSIDTIITEKLDEKVNQLKNNFKAILTTN